MYLLLALPDVRCSIPDLSHLASVGRTADCHQQEIMNRSVDVISKNREDWAIALCSRTQDVEG